MILSPSTRLGRVVDRVRALSDRLEELARHDHGLELHEERRGVIFVQLDMLTSRARLLQRCMTVFYAALGVFVATSLAIGMVAVSGASYQWAPVLTGLIGACFLFYGSVLLIFEARLALSTVRAEMDFVWRLGKRHAPPELSRRYKPRRALTLARRHGD